MTLLSFYVSTMILCTMKEVNSFRTTMIWPKSSVAWCDRSKKLTTYMSFYDEYSSADDEESFNDYSPNEEESEQSRLDRMVADRIADANRRFQDRYNENENVRMFHHPSAEEFVSDRILSREDRIRELKRDAEQKARAQRIEAMRVSLEEERRIEADKVQDEAMAAEGVRLEAQQKARDMEEKRARMEKRRADRAGDEEQFRPGKKNQGRKDPIDVDFEIVGDNKPDYYQGLMTEGMRFATEKAEMLIAQEESDVAQEIRQNTRPTKNYNIVGSPKRMYQRIVVDEARIREEMLLVAEILEEAKIATMIALDEADATELVRLAAVQSEAERIIDEKNHELAIIEKEKRLALEVVDEMKRRN